LVAMAMSFMYAINVNQALVMMGKTPRRKFCDDINKCVSQMH